MIYGIWDVAAPLLIHILISDMTALALGNRADAAFVTTVAAVIALPVLAAMYASDRKKEAAQDKAVKIPWWVGPVTAAAGVFLNQIWSAALDYLAVSERFSNAAQEGLLGSGAAAQLLGVGVLVPIVEELLFRGLVYQRLKKYFPVWAAILAGAAVFALYHGNMVQIIFAFPMGLVMLLAYEKSKSLAVPMIFHIAVNLSTVLENLLS